jgi:hypothetical protein
MDQERYADWLIERALEDGTLDIGASHGRPLPSMNRDPLWWVRGLLDRESMPERLAEAESLIDGLFDMAVKEPDLGAARDLLAKRNQAVVAWNADAPEELRLELIEETVLLTRRAEAPGT